MNSHPNMNMDSSSKVSVIRIEEINLNNAQVIPLHILDSFQDVGSEMIIPHMYITEPPLPHIIGLEKPVINTIHQIPISTENRPTTYTQFNNKLVSLTKPIRPVKSLKTTYSYNQNQQYTDVIPESSKRSAINEQIELYPLSYINYSSVKEDNFLSNTSSILNTELCVNELNPSCLSGFINHEEEPVLLSSSLTELQANPLNPPLNETIKPVKENSVPSISSNKKRKVQNYIHISDVKAPQRAVAVLPTALLLRGKSQIFPKRTLPMRIRFGPVEGVPTVITSSEAQELITKSDTPVFIIKRDDKIIHLNVSDKDKCNWMGLLPLGEYNEANLWLYQEEDELYAMTTEPINARKPLKLGYSKKYAEQHKLPPGLPTMDLDAVLSSNPKQWWCNECNRALASAPLLQRHADVYHKDDVIATRRGYRCVHCRRLYSRLYTLRRHLAKNCTKKLEKPVEKAEEPTNPIDLNTSLNDDNRLPSDESFQNFTNGLDFSASLFDTDRISNIDISGNSRADDFNPYGISFRDDTCTSNDLSFAKFGNGTNINEAKTELASQRPIRQCNRLPRKQNKRKYLNEHTSRKLDCACGRSFRSSQKLSQHYLRDHSGDNDIQMNVTSSPEKNKYTCEQCKTKRVSFKRRGMLVNHLWRAHKVVSTLKVERPVRHYPCVSCSKVYRSAAKRDKHIKVHHPGADKLLTSSIPGGVRSCDPAVCSHCPRQYATRAKLLQHVRAAHPHTLPHT